MTCCKNVGPVDRAIRAFIGAVAFALALTVLDARQGAVVGIIAVGVGAVMLLTAALGVCPLYVPLKLSTCKAGRV